MKAGALGWIGCVLLAGILAVNIGQGRDAERFNRAERERLATDVKLWKARYAEAATRVERDVDTVRLITTRYKQARDSVLINVTDTVEVLRFVAAADSLENACTELATSCTLFRATADSTVHALRVERDYLSKEYDRIRRARAWQSKLWPVALVGGVALGAWIRGQP